MKTQNMHSVPSVLRQALALFVCLGMIAGTVRLPVQAVTVSELVDSTMATAEAVSPAAVQYRELAESVYNGDQVVVPDESEAKKFLYYYYVNYRIGENMGMTLKAYRNTSTGEITIQVEDRLDRNAIMTAIANKYGAISYQGDDTATINETWKRIHAQTVYDLSYARKDPMTCLQDGRGVCWFYASCMSVLLNYEGIPTLTVSGSLKGVPHAWNLIFTGDGYYVLDPTREDNPWVSEQELPLYVENRYY